jgi:hypothetical protein
MTDPFLNERSRTLIDALFYEENQKLLEQFHDRLAKADKRQQLASLCGVDDEALLDHLIDLELEPEAVAAIAIVPLVVIAWADDSVQQEEKDAIIEAAKQSGIASVGGEYPVLEYWLTHRPSPELLNAWKMYIAALCSILSQDEIDELKDDILAKARSIAEAAGGFLGIGSKISSRERKAMKQLEAAFHA